MTEFPVRIASADLVIAIQNSIDADKAEVKRDISEVKGALVDRLLAAASRIERGVDEGVEIDFSHKYFDIKIETNFPKEIEPDPQLSRDLATARQMDPDSTVRMSSVDNRWHADVTPASIVRGVRADIAADIASKKRDIAVLRSQLVQQLVVTAQTILNGAQGDPDLSMRHKYFDVQVVSRFPETVPADADMLQDLGEARRMDTRFPATVTSSSKWAAYLR
jgi:hypothetical protein